MALKDVREISVPIELDKPRTILFDLNAFAELEDVYGSMENTFAAMQSGSMKAARTLLWAGLLHEEETLTPRKVGSMVTMENLESVLDAISGALLDAMPEEADEQEQEAIKEADPT